MNIVTMLIDGAILCGVAYVAYDAQARWRETPGTWRDKLEAVGKGSFTIVVQRFAWVVAGAAEFLPSLMDTLGAPGVASALQTVMPQGAGPYYMLVFAMLSEWARRRNLPPAG